MRSTLGMGVTRLGSANGIEVTIPYGAKSSLNLLRHSERHEQLLGMLRNGSKNGSGPDAKTRVKLVQVALADFVEVVVVLQSMDWKPWRKEKPQDIAKKRAFALKTSKEITRYISTAPVLTAEDHNFERLHREGKQLKIKKPVSGEHHKLEQMFNRQAWFQNKLGLDTSTQAYKNTHVVHLITELVEWLLETDWLANGKKSSKAKARSEIPDAWKLLINITRAAGMDAEDIFQAFVDKSKIVHARPKRKFRAPAVH